MGFVSNSNKPIKCLKLEKLANQSTFNGAFMIEMILFIKAKINLV